ncbi:lysosomal acid glucosylceramidase-like [Sitodiplosis mosellana]|uniref:lysosomal acid glucosylceramidase-like n=1 Tax=Sitodiplosis mosellana TaxID=263140 RepID=UPI00244484B8|nr:lysosomal acid glucosylceramidase-like [Sitodiplosis mosellana]
MRKCLFTSYFSQSVGAGYTYLRVPIGGTDFDPFTPWAYNEYPQNDAKLSNFTQLDSRDVERNAHIKELMQVSKNSNVNILGATWGPPPWMKFQNHWNGGVDNQLKPEYYQTWADYHLRWLELMQNDGVNVWAISTGNEPASAGQIEFQILSWNASDQAVWIADNLGPTLRDSKYSNVKIHGFDDNRDLAPDWIKGMEYGAKDAFDYLSGLEFHAYSDKALGPEILDHFSRTYPNIQIWYSENCFGAFFMTPYIGPQLGTWGRCEKLVSTLIENFSHSTVGYLDWNLLLDHKGGPSYVNNAIDAYIILSENGKKMYKQPTFYAMAHFSKFILPGSVRIDANLLECGSSKLKTIAFLRPDNKIVVIVYNSAIRSVEVTIRDKSKGNINLKLKPKSINTLVYEVGSASKCKSGKQC